MDPVFADYFRVPRDRALFETTGVLSAAPGYFRFGESICYGRCSGARPQPSPRGELPQVALAHQPAGRSATLPFDLAEVVTNLREERYRREPQKYFERLTHARVTRSLYYGLRPAMPVSVRRHLQRVRLAGWRNIQFPSWPVDFTVETLMRASMAALLRADDIERVPFIWFWPEGKTACAMMTHDVEGDAGAALCDRLMDLDDRFGINSAFQVVPEARYGRSLDLIARVRGRGFEANLHDLNHDGALFKNREQFVRRAEQINRYAREFGCRGFRSAAMYREQGWYDAFEFSYDMSVPNSAHLEPQRGGCCTVMPYFVGNILELPLTTTQDYSLFHILDDYSTRLWERQIGAIHARNGLISFIVHPDYLTSDRARAVYRELLTKLCRFRDDNDVWFALPGEIDRWWRARHAMTLVSDGASWRVEGPMKERARLAYARLDGDRVVYELGEVGAKRRIPA
jgi:hypothetical protein